MAYTSNAGLLNPIYTPTKEDPTFKLKAYTPEWIGSEGWKVALGQYQQNGKSGEDFYGTVGWQRLNQGANNSDQLNSSKIDAENTALPQAFRDARRAEWERLSGQKWPGTVTGNAATGGAASLSGGVNLSGTPLAGSQAAADTGVQKPDDLGLDMTPTDPGDGVARYTGGAAGGTKAGATTQAGATTNAGQASATAYKAPDFNTSMQNFMQSMQTFMPPPPSAPSLDQQAKNANMMAQQAYKAPELTQDQLNRTSSAWQAQQLINADSPLLGLAQARASQAGNARGLLNSTANINAGTQAMLAEAGNYGRADAGTYAQLLGQDRTNDARSRDVFAGAAFEDARSQREAEAQYRNTMLQSGANVYKGLLDNQFTLARDDRQNAFTLERDAAQNAFTLGRDAAQNEFQLVRDKAGNEFQLRRDEINNNMLIARDKAGNEFQLTRDAANNKFTSGENAANRANQLTAAQMQIDAQAARDASGFQNQLGLLGAQQQNSLATLAAQQQGAASLAAQNAAAQQALAAQQAASNLQNALATTAATSANQLANELAVIAANNTAAQTTSAIQAQNSLRTTYEGQIRRIQTDLNKKIWDIQNSDEPADNKRKKIEVAQQMATAEAAAETTLAQNNPNWVSSWAALSLEIDDVEVVESAPTGLLNAIPTTIGQAGDAGAQSASSLSTGAQGFVATIISNGWMTPQGTVVAGNERKIYDAAKAAGIKGADAAQINVWAKANGLPELT